MTNVIGVTGIADPSDEVPWSMPLAFLVDKASPASITAICEASAIATVSLLADPRTTSPEGEWHAAVERWTDGRIRKVVRRGKGSVFERSLHLPGLTVTHAGATVRAFVPGPREPLHPDLNRLQVSGSEPPERGESSEGFLTVAVNPALTMSVGKAAAQCAHAAQLAWMRMPEDLRDSWAASGFSTRVTWPTQSEWEDLLPLARERVVDAGFTEIPPGSNTTLALY